ncbi:transposase DDE domain-containing protein [Bacteroides sp. 4_1_36]|nr:transposase DDE domain-containing protein [Bacteroides sp. 4_1_36]
MELEKEVLLPMTIFIKKVLLGTCTGISFVDSTPLRVCRNQRILIHKTFEGLAERGKYSMGWSFGFKLHLIINDKGEILNFMFTPGNVDDREPLKQGKFLENIKGKLCADKGYIGQALFENPFLNGIQLVTKVKNNMKNSLMSIADKILLRKRALIETVNDELKNIEQREKSLPLIRITPIQRKAKMTLKMIHLNTSLTDICSLLIIQLIGEKRIPFTLLLR